MAHDSLRRNGGHVFVGLVDALPNAFARFIAETPDMADKALWDRPSGVAAPRVPLPGPLIVGA